MTTNDQHCAATAPAPLQIRPLPRVRYVVYEEHTLGYILAELPDSLQVLHCSVLRGGSFDRLARSVALSPMAKIRPATRQDFDDYRVCPEGHDLGTPDTAEEAQP